jgi:Lrp/AsnC family leucine-responsive transcriptional regulator
MTGTSDYLLRIVVPDLPAFQTLVTEVLARIPGVGSIQSSIALKQVKYSTALPLPGSGALSAKRSHPERRGRYAGRR